MSVIKAKRKESQFEVFHQYDIVRREVTNLLLNNFGYSLDRAEKNLSRYFGGRPYEELTPDEKVRYDKAEVKYKAFNDWFIGEEKNTVMFYLRTINEYITTANSIYPIYADELAERRILQEKAIGACYGLTRELQYAIDTLPVDANKYIRFAEMMKYEIALLKGWRKSDNKFKRVISDSAANFANVNNNGNANYNNASNSNGVRPDFNSTI